MRLVELDPRWTALNGWVSESVFYTGVSFLCPHCVADGDRPEHGPNRARRLVARFANPIDPDEMIGRILWRTPEGAWQRTGDTFDTLTLEPSIDTSAAGHWHGRITAGEVA